MASHLTYTSDLTGKVIAESKRMSLVILTHPVIDSPVRLDADVQDAVTLKDAATDMVQVEIRLPNSEPEWVWVPLTKFQELFSQGIDSQEVMEKAEHVESAVPEQRQVRVARRRSSEEYQAIREWARSQGNQVAERGRLPADVIAAYDEAHAPA